MFPVNRVVAILTPVFVIAGTAASAYLAKQGLNASPTEIVGAEIIGATAVLTPAAQWLHGHQKYEKIVSEVEKDASVVLPTLAEEQASKPVTLGDAPAEGA